MAIILSFALLSPCVYGQCTPGNEESCPDPEDNGEICPDTIAPLFINTAYEQVITMLAPPRVDTLDLNFDLHHITLISVDGLPEGITWVTNAEDDEFMTGTYYCILFSGTTSSPAGTYPLKIVVDLYAEILGEPVYVYTLTDSTSLSMEVMEGSNTVLERQSFLSVIGPNPFISRLNISFDPKTSGKVRLFVYDLTGSVVHEKEAVITRDKVSLNLEKLPPGMYLVRAVHEQHVETRMVSKVGW